MDQQKIAKHLIELHKTEFKNTLNTMTTHHVNSDRLFFRFVDKNPLLGNNSQDAIYEYLVSSRKQQFIYRPQVDESYEIPEIYLCTNDARKG